MKKCLKCNTVYDGKDWICPSCKYIPCKINNYFSFLQKTQDAECGFESSLFQQLFDLEKEHYWFCARNSLIIWALKKYFPEINNLLEIGCGTGFVLSAIEKALPNLTLYGGEIFVEGLSFAGKRLNRAQLFNMDACQIPFAGEFDVIGAFDVLEHIEKDTLALLEMHTALKANGGLILTVPQHDFLWSQFDEKSCHIRRYCIGELKNKVEKAGFKVLRVTSFTTFLLPLLFLKRFFNCRYNHGYSAIDELKVNSSANKLLKKVYSLEYRIISSGFSFPVGGSLLLVAKKV